MNAIRINQRDNVAVALASLKAGDTAYPDKTPVILENDIAAGHKFALQAIPAGARVIKYGYPIGRARTFIAPGEHVHVHNLESLLGEEITYSYEPLPGIADEAAPAATRRVPLYPREDGQYGTRNELWVLPLVSCVTMQAQEIVARFREKTGQAGIDGAFALFHPFGCSQLGEDHAAMRRLLQNIARHPNAGGILLLGLGCENNTMAEFLADFPDHASRPVETLVCQHVSDEIAEGVARLETLYERARKVSRVDTPVSALNIGMKCGGSDAFSGITANPLVGRLADLHVRQGGGVVLTETPEMFGAETILMNRCASAGLFRDMVTMINEFKRYFTDHGQPVFENPSPGNREGGITTLEEKSLGCIQKGGHSAVHGIVPYAERLRGKGLTLLNSPGNDPVSTTALGAAGCQLLLYTTGRGTPFTCFVPCLKIASNSDLAIRKAGWIDYNAGSLVEGRDPDEAAAELYTLALRVAAGETFLAHEKYMMREVAIWKNGVTL